MIRWKRFLAVCATLVVWAVVPPSCRSQLSAGFAAANFQFNLSNPGARSLGMGGAFVARADDATAAYANPAGLTQLTEPESSFEARHDQATVPFYAGDFFIRGAGITTAGSGSTRPPGFSAIITGAYQERPLGALEAGGSTASFASFVYPRRRWTVALYHHQLARLDARAEIAGTAAALSPTNFTPSTTRAVLDLDLTGLGVAVGYKASEWLSLGLALVANDSSFSAESFKEWASGEGFNQGDEVLNNLETHSLLRSDDSDLTLNAGILLRPHERIGVGLVYRQGPRFRLLEVAERNASVGRIPIGVEGRSESDSESFHVPDVIALGVAVQVTARLVLASEWDRVRYSNLRRRSVEFPERLGEFRIEDANEIRVGGEYSFWNVWGAPAVRFGAWLDRDHRVRFLPAASCPVPLSRLDDRVLCEAEYSQEVQGVTSIEEIEALFLAVFDAVRAGALATIYPIGEDQVHWAGGFGLVLRSGLQVDAAFDYVDGDRYTVSLSGVVRF